MSGFQEVAKARTSKVDLEGWMHGRRPCCEFCSGSGENASDPTTATVLQGAPVEGVETNYGRSFEFLYSTKSKIRE